jgi:hypothetical protein
MRSQDRACPARRGHPLVRYRCIHDKGRFGSGQLRDRAPLDFEIEVSAYLLERSKHIKIIPLERRDCENVAWGDQSFNEADHLLCKAWKVVVL